MNRRLGIAIRIVVVVVIAAVVSLRSVPPAHAEDGSAGDPLELAGSGSFDVSALMNAWGNPMFAASSPVNLSYIANGDRDGRSQLSLGQVDFAISGMPLNDDDKQRLAARNVSVIDAPLATAAMTFLYAWPSPPYGLNFFVPDDPTDPFGTGVNTPYSGPIRMTNSVLAQTMSGVSGYRLYHDPDFTSLFVPPAGATFAPPPTLQWAVARSDPGASDYYLEQFLLQFAPDDYNSHLASQNLPANALSESWPLLDMPARSGPQSVSDLISSWNCPCGQGFAQGGSIGPVDPTTAAHALAQQDLKRTDPADNPGTPTPLSIVQVQNGAGEWVDPTPASITTAAAAGNGQALYGLSQNVPGAYPFTWTTDLFVPSTGLSIDKTNAIATFLRYATGPGQDLAASVNEGQLPAGLRLEAASKADDIVKGNCQAAGGTTKVDPTGGSFWPTGVPVPSGGTLLCVAPPAAPSTTAAATSAGSSSGGSLTPGFGATAFTPLGGSSSGAVSSSCSYSSSGVGSDSGVSAAEESNGSGSGAAGTSSGGAANVPATQAAAKLPLPIPDDGQFALDRFTTILLGALTFLAVRSFVRPRLVGAT